VAKFEDPVFEGRILSMTLSPDSNSLYIGTQNKLLQFSLKGGKVIQSRDIKDRLDMKFACISEMSVTRNNQYLITGTMYFDTPTKYTKEELSEKELLPAGGPVCVWSTKDLTLVRT
jgi:hypothetical protein